MILIIDNYDSFTYNLVQLVGSLHPDVRVVRNRELPVAELMALAPQAVIASPGPGRPVDAGVTEDAIRAFGAAGVPVLGVCLGHQAICEVYGARIGYAPQLMHGKRSRITVADAGGAGTRVGTSDAAAAAGAGGLFAGLPGTLQVGRYHSLVAEPETVPAELVVTATADDDGSIMAVRHRELPVFGVQFHPESILTPDGPVMLRNFLAIAGVSVRAGAGLAEVPVSAGDGSAEGADVPVSAAGTQGGRPDVAVSAGDDVEIAIPASEGPSDWPKSHSRSGALADTATSTSTTALAMANTNTNTTTTTTTSTSDRGALQR